MGKFLRLLFDWLVDSFQAFFDLLFINILWLLLCLPVVTAPAGTLALFATANHLAHDRTGSWRVFWEAFRRDFWLSLRWGVLNLAVIAVLASNIVFYAQYEQTWSGLVQGIFVSLGWVWGLLQLFALPLLMEQTDRRVRIALRNSLVLWARNPSFTLGFGLTLGASVVLISVFLGPPWLVIGAALAAYLANRAVLHLITDIP